MPMVILLILGAVALATLLTGNATASRDAISYDEFVRQVKADNVARVVLAGDHLDGEFVKELPAGETPGRKPQKTFSLDLNPYLREGFDRLMQEHDEIKKLTRTPADGTGLLMGLYMLVPLLLMAGFWMTLRRARDPLGNTGFLGGFSKSPAKRYAAGEKQVTVTEVAGHDPVKAVLHESGAFLKDPLKVLRLC
ncbi:MAG: ATP-dependent metallopeptidase FtsH/Yme1/Tma family protein, partial [Planctomycetota bacterium]